MAPAGCWRDRFARVLDEAVAGAMRQGKTQHLCDLENLRAKCFSCRGSSATSVLYKGLFLVDLTKFCRNAQAMSERLRKHFVFDIDQDVDYEMWTKVETWTLHATEASSPWGLPYDKTTSKEERIALAKEAMDWISSQGAKSGSMDRSEVIWGMINKFAGEANHDGAKKLDNILNGAWEIFCAALREIKRAINAKHDSAFYKEIFHDQRIHYEKTISQDVNDAYSAWKEQHLDDDIEVEALREYVDEAMEELFQANVFDGIKDGAGRKKREAYRSEVCFDECDRSKAASYDKAYACFREVFDYRDGEYVIDKVKAGKLLFKIRKEPDKVKAFFWFVQTLALVGADIDEIHGRQCVESVCDGVDFRDLRSRFSEAEVKASGIRNHADIVLALIDRMQREKIPNTYWLAFFCVLSQKKWIEGNVRAFASNMNSIFDIKLDHSALSRNMKDWGNDVSLWPEEYERQRKRKAFGQKFQKLVEAYVEYKKRSILAT